MHISQEDIKKLVDDAYTAAKDAFQSGNFHRAKDLYGQILRVSPEEQPAVHMLGLSLHRLGKNKEALPLLQQAVKDDPDNWALNNSLGVVYGSLHLKDEAIRIFKKALDCEPMNGVVLNNLAIQYQHQQLFDEAHQALAAALVHDPDSAVIRFNIGNCYSEQGRMSDAIKWYEAAMCNDPNMNEARWNLATSLLSLGTYIEGFQEYEIRWKLFGNYERIRRSMPDVPDWSTKNSLVGKTILLYCEQGAGDAIQFIRFATSLKKLGAKKVLVDWRTDIARGDLTDVLQSADGVDEVVNVAEDEVKCDYKQSLLSLPWALGIEYGDIRCDKPYLRIEKSDDSLIGSDRRWKHWKDIFNIGIVWAGNPANKNDAKRSCPLKFFEAFKGIPKVQFHSLQNTDIQRFAPDETEIDLIEEADIDYIDWEPSLVSFHDTAEVINRLDLIVTVDTAVAHLAGAMDHPNVFVMLPHVPDWRWGLEHKTTPWYPRLRLFRQESPGDWSKPFEKAAEAAMERS